MKQVYQLSSRYIYTPYKDSRGRPRTWLKPKAYQAGQELAKLAKLLFNLSLWLWKLGRRMPASQIPLVISILLISLLPRPSHVVYADPIAQPVNVVMLKSLPQADFKPLSGVDYLVSQPSPSPVNLYAPGNCTWGVASWINIPQDLGNANSWAANAAAKGYRVSNTPLVGAVASTTAGSLGHVALVTAVTDSTVTVKEMNYQGYGLVDYRTTPISDWVYIFF